MSSVFQILVVCTGNICRSAQAEQLIRARIATSFPDLESLISVESAGTGALAGSPMPPEASVLSRRHGGEPDGHSARQLTAVHVKEADLVLAMAGEHRSSAVRLLPRASRKTFTLTEFAALLDSAERSGVVVQPDFAALHPVERLRVAVKWASNRRGHLPPEDASPADVIDPYRRSDEVYEESARQIVEALDRLQRTAESMAKQVNL